MPDGLAVLVDGLRDLQRELRAADRAFPRELRVANKAAADLVAADTRASFAARPGSAPKVAETVRAMAEQRSASVRIGGGSSVGGIVAMGNEFGGGRRPRTRQFPPWRGNGADAGYSLFPSIRANTDRIVTTYSDAIERLIARAFPT